MANIRYGMEQLLEALEPGLCALVMRRFEDKLTVKMSTVVEDVFRELKAELPTEISAKIYEIFKPEQAIPEVKVEVDLRGFDQKEETPCSDPHTS